MSLVLAAITACGGSSESSFDPNGPSAGSGGALGISGSSNTTGGRQSSGSSGSASAGKPAAGGEPAVGGEAPMGPENGGDDAGGAPGKPPKPPEPPLGMGGEGGGANADCPLQPPSNAATCTTPVKCGYPELTCDCGGPEADRHWKCKEPPKPMTMCPPMAPKDASACVTKDVEPPPPPCHYEEPAVECKCTADKWACVEVVAP